MSSDYGNFLFETDFSIRWGDMDACSLLTTMQSI